MAERTYASDSSGSIRRERVDLCAVAMGSWIDRALALGELERRAHGLERQQDVREEDGRVDAEPQRLHRHLDRKLGRLANVEERMRLAQFVGTRAYSARLGA